ncbi:unnamed protein product [Fusarium venenatum]|uniref:Uncharacterized protein n=1 Tax=Fusarium venenatum TaxID=56646 RepID=A0A2L2TKY5_9HYPO|nr:uncharacterized protein FVRRES_08890 [Fusarium venenatum]KAH6965623.1 hypothetical protein EDB82DRAFT_529342 [Fusarium venenatum]CEI68813.1 unnamed protein product [Fusarium venenatum]
MCYFDQTRWACGFWRWGHFRQQCNKEYRMGETCGLKLVYETKNDPEVCKLCSDIEKKQRRYDKMYRDVQRWQREGNRDATIERTCIEMSEVAGQMHRMREEHAHRLYTLGQDLKTDLPTGYIELPEQIMLYCSALPIMVAYGSFGELMTEQRSTRTPTHVIL